MNIRTPTLQEQDQILLVQNDVFEAVNRLRAEGILPHILLTGIAAAAADTAASFIGVKNVPTWFRTNADALEATSFDGES